MNEIDQAVGELRVSIWALEVCRGSASNRSAFPLCSAKLSKRAHPIWPFAGTNRIMKHDQLQSAIECALFTYLLMNRHSSKEEDTAQATLTLHLNGLAASGEHDHQRLVVGGLVHLREFDQQKAVRQRQ